MSIPKPIGPYSPARRAGNTLYLSGQIGLDEDIKTEVMNVFRNLSTVAESEGGSLNQFVKLTVFLTDFAYFPVVNEVMTELFKEPYPARSTVQVSALPKGARVEVEAVMIIE